MTVERYTIHVCPECGLVYEREQTCWGVRSARHNKDRTRPVEVMPVPSEGEVAVFLTRGELEWLRDIADQASYHVKDEELDSVIAKLRKAVGP